ncbi:YcjF family protein [Plastorhodobacter daqingensis]|uniref:YcjF family protein n=1 Tax=Plastorhodobacter daqingensis TaxID=1387281 RepID=A0ABW2UI68_9RHOB
MTEGRDDPLLIELDGEGPSPADAPPIEDAPEGRAMRRAAQIAARGRRGSLAGRLFLAAAGGFLTLVLSLAAWDFVARLLARVPVLGAVAGLLLVLLLCAAVALALRELLAFARLRRIDQLRDAAEAAVLSADRAQALRVVAGIEALYAGREDLAWARRRLGERRDELFDASALIDLAETELLAPLDEAARLEVAAAARQVAAVTAFVPLAFADVAAALLANLRMIRRLAEIYGGRTGTLGAWRLTRAVLAHLVATGAVAVGDDLIGAAAGGGVISKLSRRFGEGVVNGALTARVGVAAMEVCRPLPFRALAPPRTSALVSLGVTGLFARV